MAPSDKVERAEGAKAPLQLVITRKGDDRYKLVLFNNTGVCSVTYHTISELLTNVLPFLTNLEDTPDV